MRQQGSTPRHHAASLPPERAQRLLRAVQEMRALDRARQETVAAGRRPDAGAEANARVAADDLARKVEAKAREIFRLAETDDDVPEGPPTTRTH